MLVLREVRDSEYCIEICGEYWLEEEQEDDYFEAESIVKSGKLISD